MDSFEIEEACLRDCFLREYFQGVYPIDRLPRRVYTLPAAFIINTDVHDGAGLHWIAIYIDVNKRGYLFDSFGEYPTSPYIIKFLRDNCYTFDYNATQLQSIFTSVCGKYCVLFLMNMARGLHFSEMMENFSPDNPSGNDLRVEKIFNSRVGAVTTTSKRRLYFKSLRCLPRVFYPIH